MREAGPSGLFVLRPDVIPELQVHDRRRVILGEDDRQAVGQRRDLVLRAWAGGRRPTRRGGERNDSPRRARRRQRRRRDEKAMARLSPISCHRSADDSTVSAGRAGSPPGTSAAGLTIERIGVDVPLEAGKELERALPSDQPDAAFDASAASACPRRQTAARRRRPAAPCRGQRRRRAGSSRCRTRTSTSADPLIVHVRRAAPCRADIGTHVDGRLVRLRGEARARRARSRQSRTASADRPDAATRDGTRRRSRSRPTRAEVEASSV